MLGDKIQEVEPKLKLGDKVVLSLADDISGPITAICTRLGAGTSYEVTYFHNGEVKCVWFPAEMLKRVKGGS